MNADHRDTGYGYGYSNANQRLCAEMVARGWTLDVDAEIAVHVISPAGFVPRPGKRNVLYCLAPETRVLRADLRWVAVGDLRPGVEVVAFDERLGPANKMRRAVVRATSRFRGPALRIVTDQGEIVASGNHRWVAWQVGRRAGRRWVRTDGLRPGDRICRWVSPWTEPRSYEAGWLAGFLDGEGHVSNGGNGGAVGFAQKPGPTLERACALLDSLGFSTHRTEHRSGVVGVRIHAGLRALGTLRPQRLLARAALLWDGQRSWSSQTTHATVLAIEHVGMRELVGTETTTGTLVVEGLLSHNTMWESPDFPFVARPYLDSADLVVVPARFNVELFAPHVSGPIEVVPLGCDVDAYAAVERPWRGGADDPFQWLLVGAANARKGWDVLEIAWKRHFLEREDCQLYLKTTGTRQAYEEALREGAEPTGHEGVVVWRNMILDFRNLRTADLVATYHRSHGFAFPSAGEGWGLTLMEAMATGLPCIVTRWSGLLDFTNDRVVRYVDWSPCDETYHDAPIKGGGPDALLRMTSAWVEPDELAQAMREVMGNYAAARRMGRRAAAHVRRFTWSQAGDALARVLARFADGASSDAA